MSRKKTVTTVSIDPEIFQMGREEGFNFSEILEEAIVDKTEPEKEILYLQGQINYHQRKIAELTEQMKAAEKAENSIKKYIIEDAIKTHLPEYRRLGVLSDSVEESLCERLSVSKKKLLEIFDDNI